MGITAVLCGCSVPLLLLFLLMDTSFVTGAELRYYVTEGSETGVVGNPVVDSNLEASLGSLSEVQFNFVSPNNSQSRFFSIDHASGEISSTESLDREVLCVVGVCPVNLDVAVQSATSELELVQILRVRVHVHDVNDNTPTFPSPTVKVSIPENTPVETTFPLPAATDPDTTRNNSRVTYELSPSGGLGKFGLSVVINWDGSTDIGIVVKDKLDREVVDFYQVKVIAKDGGTPSLTGTLSVNITVADSNDHTPVFVKPMWNVTISENVTFGTEVLRVSANDGDVGVNGRVTYKFNSRSASKVGSIFSMDKTTGAITVIGPVDFERSDVYHLIVEATDNGIPPKSSQSPVTINVLDVNDNPPDITFNLLAGGDHALVSEYAKPGSFVAHVSVKDLDSENTQRISCRMQSSEFSLQRMSEKEYKIILLSRLDRETVAEYNLSVTCDDNGAPSLQATNTLLVSVKDENDHSPVFQRTKYSMSIEENFPLGKSIIQISASDADVGENANVTYGFVNYREGVLSIDSSTGEIVAKDRLDREKNPTVSVHIIAVDNGEPKLTSTSLLELTLVDVNDVPPKFTKSEYQVQITENQYVHTDLRPLLVTDPDSGPGGEFYFTLLESTAPSGVFMVSQTDGSIKTVHRFDREEMDEYRLVVMATDRGDTPLSSSATVVIKIDDVNDNVPVIHYPTGINNSVHVTSWRVDTFVAAVNATDRDVKENGRLTYTIEDAEATDFLYIDEKRGIIRLAFDLDERFAGSYEVTVRVKDNGQPVNSVSQTLNVLITSVNGTALETNARSSNMAIVIAVVAITVIVSLAILTGICIVRKQSENKRNQPLEVEERKIMHRRGSSSTASKTSQQSDLSTVTCLDELRKDVSFAISEDSQGRGSMAPCYLLRSQQQRPTITDPAHLEILDTAYLGQKYDPLRPSDHIEDEFGQLYLENNNKVRHSHNSSDTLTNSDSGRGGSDDDLNYKIRVSNHPGTQWNTSHGEDYVRFIRPSEGVSESQQEKALKLSSFRKPSPKNKHKEENHYYDMTVFRKSLRKSEQPGSRHTDGQTNVPPGSRPLSLHTGSPENPLCEENRSQSQMSLPPYYMKPFGDKSKMAKQSRNWSRTDSRSYSLELDDLDSSTNI